MDKYGISVEVQSKLGTAQRDLNVMQSSMLGLVKKFGQATLGIGSMSAALLILKKQLEASYKASMQLNEGLANVATLIPGQADRILELKDSVKKLSTETGKPLDDLTNGLYQVVSAFGDSIETEERLEAVTKASIAGQSTTVDSLNLLSAVTKAYGDTSVSALKKVSDLAFETVRLGQTTFPELANSMQQVTDSANRLNVSQEELFGAFATLTGVTGNASTVATQYRSALVALEAPSDDLKKLYDELGVASGKALIEQYGLQGAFEEVVNYSDRTGTSLQSLLGRVQAMTFASSLAGAQSETYARKLGEIDVATGSTDKALLEVTDGIDKNGFALKQLKAEWAVLQTTIGDKVQPIMADLYGSFKETISRINANNISVYNLNKSYNDLISSTSEYNSIVNQLQENQGNLTVLEERTLKIRKEQASLDISKSLNELARNYKSTEDSLTNYENKIKSSTSSQEHWTKRIEDLNEQLKKEHPESINAAEIRAKINSANVSLTNSTLALDKAQQGLRSTNLETEATILQIAKAANDGTIRIDAYAESFPELYARIKEAQEDLANAPPIDTGLDGKDNVQKTLDSFIGFNARQLKAKLAEYEEQKNLLMMGGEKTFGDIPAIIAGLNKMITSTEKDFVEVTKESLEWKIKEAGATNELAKLEVGRKKALADITNEIGKHEGLEELINELYKMQGDTLKENYTEQLKNQLFAVRNENELLGIEEQRRVAIKKMNDEGMNTEENLNTINSIYDTMRFKSLQAQREQLTYNDMVAGDITELERLELDRAKAIEESVKQYGYQKDLIDLINSAYDKQKAKLEKSISLYSKMEDAFKDAIGPKAYEEFKGLQNAIVKTGKFVNDLSMIWESFGNMMSAVNDAQMQAMKYEIEGLQLSADIKRKDADKEIKNIEDEKDEKLDSLQEMYDKDAISYEDYVNRKLAIQTQFDADKAGAEEEAIAAENEVKTKQYQADVRQHEIDKTNAISNAIMAGAQGIMQAWALGPIAGAIGSALIGVMTGIQVSKISSTPAPRPPVLLAEGGIATRPTSAIIGEGGEPEMVLPLSKAKNMGFGDGGDTYNISGNTFVGIAGIDELLIAMDKRRGVLKSRGAIA